MKKMNSLLACTAVAAFILGQPAIASATRSADMLPLIGVQAADTGADHESCGKVGEENNVRIDANGNAILDASGNLIHCGKPGGGDMGEGGGLGNGVGIGLLVAGIAGGIAAATGGNNGNNASPG